MKKIAPLLSGALFAFVLSSTAQIQRGNILVGGDIARFNLSMNSGNGYDILINPKMAYFIDDGLAIGPYITLGLSGAKHVEPTTIYGLGAIGRYYADDAKLNLLKHGRFFVEANAGIEGDNNSENDVTTNGLGLGIGPGYAYFITPNIGLETLFKYNGIIGFGSSVTNSNLTLSLGFQIYLPSKKARDIVTNPNP